MAMLRKGGSATDAALAMMLALTVVEPQSSGNRRRRVPRAP
jgi:gamma-glutamyltranspeptidase/glutathione hydrolase